MNKSAQKTEQTPSQQPQQQPQQSIQSQQQENFYLTLSKNRRPQKQEAQEQQALFDLFSKKEKSDPNHNNNNNNNNNSSQNKSSSHLSSSVHRRHASFDEGAGTSQSYTAADIANASNRFNNVVFDSKGSQLSSPLPIKHASSTSNIGAIHSSSPPVSIPTSPLLPTFANSPSTNTLATTPHASMNSNVPSNSTPHASMNSNVPTTNSTNTTTSTPKHSSWDFHASTILSIPSTSSTSNQNVVAADQVLAKTIEALKRLKDFLNYHMESLPDYNVKQTLLVSSMLSEMQKNFAHYQQVEKGEVTGDRKILTREQLEQLVNDRYQNLVVQIDKAIIISLKTAAIKGLFCEKI